MAVFFRHERSIGPKRDYGNRTKWTRTYYSATVMTEDQFTALGFPVNP